MFTLETLRGGNDDDTIKLGFTSVFFTSDSVNFTVSLNHDALSGDNAWNVLLVWILPYYAVFKSHEPETNITSPHPGEYHIGVSQSKKLQNFSFSCSRFCLKKITIFSKNLMLFTHYSYPLSTFNSTLTILPS